MESIFVQKKKLVRHLRNITSLIIISSIINGCAAGAGAVGGSSAGVGAGAGIGSGVAGLAVGALGLYGAYALGKKIYEDQRANEYVSVLSHMSTALQKQKSEPLGFGLYTYVLLGEKPNNVDSPCESKNFPKECKYEKVLYETQKNSDYKKRKENEKKSSIGFNKAQYNLFLIPSYPTIKNVDLKDYNYNLSFSYLEALNYATNGKFNLLKREGPFLVTLKKPISFKEKDAYALYVDLTDASPEIISETLSTYKQRLQSPSGNTPFSNLEIIKADFIKNIVNFNNDIDVFLEKSN